MGIFLMRIYDGFYTSSLLHHDSLILTKWQFGNIEKLERVDSELIGDVLYTEHDLSRALLAYEESLLRTPHDRIREKISLLKFQSGKQSKKESTLSWSLEKPLREAMKRIETDQKNQSTYIERWSSSPEEDVFFTMETETIDW
jgi:hypothetical protein